MTSVLKRKDRLDAKSYGNVKRMGKRETEKKKEKGRRREKRRKYYGAQWLGSKGRVPGRYMCGKVVHERVFLCPTGPEWDMCPRISKTRVASSRLRSQDKKELKFVVSFPPQQ